MNQEFRRLKDNLANKIPPGNTAQSEDSILSEIDEREIRKKNLIIYGFAEDQTQGDSSDLSRIEEGLVSLNLNSIKLTKCFRIGRFSESLMNPRPLKIITSSSNDADTILQMFQTRKRDKTLPQTLRELQFQHDWTVLQRQKYARYLKKEVDLRKSQGEKDIRIVTKNGVSKIVASKTKVTSSRN